MVDRHVLVDDELACRKAACVVQRDADRDRAVRIGADMAHDLGVADLEQIDRVVGVGVVRIRHLQRGGDAAALRFLGARERERIGIIGRLLGVRATILDDIEQSRQIARAFDIADIGLHRADRMGAGRIRTRIARDVVECSVREAVRAAVTADRFVQRQGCKARGAFASVGHRHQDRRTIVEK